MNKANIPRLLKSTILYSAALAVMNIAFFSGAAEAQHPNILFVFCDDHAYQAISAYGIKDQPDAEH